MSTDDFNKKYNSEVQQNTQSIPQRQTLPTIKRIDIVKELEGLHALKEKGIITEAEFQAQKAKLLI